MLGMTYADSCVCVCVCVLVYVWGVMADSKDDDTEEARTQASEQRTPLGMESISVGGGRYTSNDVVIGYGTRRSPSAARPYDVLERARVIIIGRPTARRGVGVVIARACQIHDGTFIGRRGVR